MRVTDPIYRCIHGTAHTAAEMRQALAWAAETYHYDTQSDPHACYILAWRQSVNPTLSHPTNVPGARAGYRQGNGTRAGAGLST